MLLAQKGGSRPWEFAGGGFLVKPMLTTRGRSLLGLSILKVLVAAVVISFVSWLAGKKTGLAGFLTALPLTSLLALAFAQLQWSEARQSVEYAKSIFIAVPVSLLFFVPFLFAERFQLGFWTCYLSGIVLLAVGYWIHTFALKIF